MNSLDRKIKFATQAVLVRPMIWQILNDDETSLLRSLISDETSNSNFSKDAVLDRILQIEKAAIALARAGNTAPWWDILTIKLKIRQFHNEIERLSELYENTAYKSFVSRVIEKIEQKKVFWEKSLEKLSNLKNIGIKS